jgi:hypothetical protein
MARSILRWSKAGGARVIKAKVGQSRINRATHGKRGFSCKAGGGESRFCPKNRGLPDNSESPFFVLGALPMFLARYPSTAPKEPSATGSSLSLLTERKISLDKRCGGGQKRTVYISWVD